MINYTPLFLDKLRKADQKSFEQAYHDLFPSLVLFAKKYVDDDGVSEDLVQEVFIRLWNNSAEINIHTSLKSYLYTTVRNSAINHLKQKAVEEKRIRKNYVEEAFVDEGIALSQDVYYHIHNAIKCLPKKSQVVIRMSLNGMSIADIQDELGVSKNTVKTHKRIAFSKLREKLKNLFMFFSPLF